jgi:RimJ/RimL family protein N-acetyltransferase
MAAPESALLLELPRELRGPRVLLRPYRPEDAPALWEAVEESREHLARWLPWAGSLRSSADVRLTIIRMQARWILREDLTMGIFDRAGGRLLGGTGLHRMDWQARCFEVGYWVRKTSEGRGYVTEAA